MKKTKNSIEKSENKEEYCFNNSYIDRIAKTD